MQGTPDLERGTDEAQVVRTAPIQADEMRSALEKVLSSRTFGAAQGQQIFLRFIVEQVVAGRAHVLKEYVIGTEALGRGDSFDPRLDPIVRTQARKLRARLDKYYETEGADDELRIDFPKGSYVPAFRRAPPQTVCQPTVTQAQPEVPVELTIPKNASIAAASFPWRLSAICFLVLLVTVGVFFMRGHASDEAVSNEASLAVLPFINLGPAGKQDEFLGDGLTDELIESLRSVRGLQVVAHTSAFRFKGKSIPEKEIGRQLGVNTILLGSVKRADGHLYVSAQLNSVPNGFHLWSGSFERNGEDSREIEIEIARSVANVLGMDLTRTPGGQAELVEMLSRRPLPNPNAHESYIKGLYFWNKLTPEAIRTATRYFEESISEDPSFARAYSALADCYVIAPQLSMMPPAQVSEKIKAAANRALALDDSLGEAYIDLAVSDEYEFDWVKAEAEFKQGLSLTPGNAVGHLWYAKYLALMGRKSEVLTQRRLAADLDPVSAYAAQAVAGYFSVTGHYDAAISQFRSALALEPSFGLAHQGLGFTYILAGRRSEGLEELKIAQKTIGDPRRMALVAYAYAVCGQTGYARQVLDGLLEQSRREPFPALAIADVYIGLGDKDRAFEWLERAVEQRDLSLDLQWDPLFQSVRSDPRYTVLLHKMKLA